MKKYTLATLLLTTALISAPGLATNAYAHDGWQHGQGQGMEHRHHGHLSQEQMKLLRETMRNVHEQNKPTIEELHKLHKELYSIVKADTFDKQAFLSVSPSAIGPRSDTRPAGSSNVVHREIQLEDARSLRHRQSPPSPASNIFEMNRINLIPKRESRFGRHAPDYLRSGHHLIAERHNEASTVRRRQNRPCGRAFIRSACRRRGREHRSLDSRGSDLSRRPERTTKG